MKHTVMVVAAQRATRQQLEALLVGGGLDVVAVASDACGLDAEADAVVIGGGPADPAPALAQASLALPGTRLVVVLAVVDRRGVRRALRAGAAAVVREQDAERSLAHAVHGACSGQLSIPFDLAGGMDKPVLSAREKQILGMVVMGFTNGEVARRLYLAESTVKSHMSSIFGKLGVSSRMEAVAVVLDPEHGLGLGILSISDDPAAAAPVAAGDEAA